MFCVQCQKDLYKCSCPDRKEKLDFIRKSEDIIQGVSWGKRLFKLIPKILVDARATTSSNN